MFIRYRAEYYELCNIKMVRVYDHQTGETKVYELKVFWEKMADEFSHNGGFIYGREDDQCKGEDTSC